jgi:hypothetical protein
MKYLMIIAVALLTACAQKTYVKNGVSSAQSNMDKAACELFATQAVNADLAVGNVGPISGEIKRNSLVGDCLTTKGYTAQSIK